MPKTKFDQYYRYDELTRLLHDYAGSHPNLLKIESIGKSHEGRDVWLLTATNFGTGPDTEKPALWVDGNMHASEVAASTAVLYHLHRLVTKYGQDEDITRALDTRAFYLVPRVNPDGAEWALADKPKVIRSSTRPYPYDEEPVEGLLQEDIDGDGRILFMRVKDPTGAWKQHPDEPRLLIRRDPAETGGTYYRILPEGRLQNYDGVTIQVRSPKENLDLNRNFPVAWRQEADQSGAGPYPVSEPEARNLADFIVRHPNITGVIAFHTFSSVLLRPYDDRPDEAFPAEDLWAYQKIGDKGTEVTGYPNVAVYHDFRYHPKTVTTGAFDTWTYDHLGVFAWTVELWSPMKQAGLKNYKWIDWFREHPVKDDLKLLKWSDEKLGKDGYVDWYEFDHPQLGKVELGGWDWLHTWTNPPRPFLADEVKAFPKWLVWHALISPKLELRDATATALGGGTYRVRMVVENSGWLPTYVTKKALEKKLRGVVCEIELPEGAKLEAGKQREELGQLEGRAYKDAMIDTSAEGTQERLKVEWVVQAPAGGTVRLVARHDRAGTVRAEVGLPPGPK
ncbi:MAG: M14 family metallopeptidase [Anaerolineae bacterium]